MADNMRWFKVWTTLLGDYFLEDISLEDVGRFILLGCLIAKKGSKGKYEIESDALCKLLNFAKDEQNFAIIPENFAKDFNVEIEPNDNGTFSVSFKNWTKYQKDSTGYKRLKNWREKQNDNGVDNGNDNGDKTKKKTKTKTKKKTKNKYGEYQNVLLSEDEYESLTEDFKPDGRDGWIKTLDEGIALKGYKYKSHYLAILAWARKEDANQSEDAFDKFNKGG